MSLLSRIKHLTLIPGILVSLATPGYAAKATPRTTTVQDSQPPVCGTELVQIVWDHLRPYIYRVIHETVESSGASSEQIYALESDDDMYQEVLLALWKTDSFRFDYHGDVNELQNNSHLREYVSTKTQWVVNDRLRHLTAAKRGGGTITLPISALGVSDLEKLVDESSRSIEEIVAERPHAGEAIKSDFTAPPVEIGVSENLWAFMLANLQRHFRRLSKEYGVSEETFWAAQGGEFTETDFGEELAQQCALWKRNEFGEFDRQQVANIVLEITLRTMFEELTGITLVKERTLEWMQRDGKLSVNRAAFYFRESFIRGLPSDMAAKELRIPKATVSWRKMNAQDIFQTRARILLQYPLHYQYQVGVEVRTLPERLYLGLIDRVETLLGKANAKAVADKFDRSQFIKNISPEIAKIMNGRETETKQESSIRSAVSFYFRLWLESVSSGS